MPPITAETRAGRIEGVQEDGVAIFRGIPFARPPVGELRFLAPVAPEPWSGTRDATRFGACALQADTAGSPMSQLIRFEEEEASEDCLTLSVNTPALDTGRRPVMVWIHGGAFVFGSGSQPMYDGRHLAARGDVVVVTINYRLGVFGWLHDEALGATGNQGLLDQVAALRWVQAEIEGFGGDPDNVTIFGESAGSISISALLAAPQATGLFHKAILQSGAPNLTHPMIAARRTAARIRDAATTELRELPAAALQAVQDQATPRSAGVFYGPVVEPEVLPLDPFDAIAAGSAAGVPLLVGTNLDEWRFFMGLDPRTSALDDAGLRAVLSAMIGNAGTTPTPETIERVIATVREARRARGEPVTPTELWYALGGDFVFRHPAMRVAELQSKHASAFAYLFDWPSPVLGGVIGAGHLVEVPFVFGTHRQPSVRSFAGEGAEADLLSTRMQDAWLAFARTGEPGHAGLPDWSCYDGKQRATMRLGAECRTENAPLEAERAVWDALA
jgi:para-nitrobenzyl esterase